MRRDVARDLEWSTNAFKTYVAPALGPEIGATEFIQGEAAQDYLRGLLDTMSGIDWYAARRRTGMVALASRVQRGQHKFSTFTVRFARENRTRTEYAKRLAELADDTLLGPTLMSHAYVSANALLRGAVARTKEVLAAAQQLGTMKRTGTGEWFLAVEWAHMRAEGYTVTAFGPSYANIMQRIARDNPACVVCGRAVVAGQTDPAGRPAHFECQ